MNSIIGKLCQRTSFGETIYVKNADEIEEILAEGQTICNFTNISEDICQIETKKSKNKDSRKTNPTLSAFVTALSRIDMHKHILTLVAHDFLPMYTDTDSLVFSGLTKDIPLPISGSLGDFKHEYKEDLKQFCCIGKKNYAISLRSKKEDADYFRVRGLSFESQKSQAALSFSDFEKFLKGQGQRSSVKVPQSRRKCEKSSRISKEIVAVRVATELNFHRILTDTKYFRTLPYGYVSCEYEK